MVCKSFGWEKDWCVKLFQGVVKGISYKCGWEVGHGGGYVLKPVKNIMIRVSAYIGDFQGSNLIYIFTQFFCGY